MSHFAFLCVPTSGHIAPLVAVARELESRGHKTTFFHHADAAPVIEAYGVAFVSIRASEGANRFAAAMERVTHVRGYRGIRAVLRDFAEASAMFCEELPKALRRLDVDAIVSDALEPAGGLVAHHLGLPFVSIAAALPLNWTAGDVSPFLNWSRHERRWHRYANISVQWVAERVQRPVRKVIETYARRWGLPAHRRVQDWASGFAQITQLLPSLDFERQSLIGCFHYCGPLRSRMPAPASRPSARLRRRAFASLGSLQGHRAEVFEWIADAAEALDLELTIAHGGLLSEADAARLSRRAKVHAFVDYASVLDRSDIAIMHGGLNGVLDTLAHGVPLIVVPLAFEQGAIAARVQRSGAGRVCRPMARRGRLAKAIGAVLGDPSYAAAAARMRDEIASAGGACLAVDIIEQVARTRAPCLNAAGLAAHPELARCALDASSLVGRRMASDELVDR